MQPAPGTTSGEVPAAAETIREMDIGVEDYINEEVKWLSIHHLLQFLCRSNCVRTVQCIPVFVHLQ